MRVRRRAIGLLLGAGVLYLIGTNAQAGWLFVLGTNHFHGMSSGG